MPELSELHGYGATGLHSRSQGYGDTEEGKGVQLWWLRAWEMEVGYGGHGGHGHGDRELVESSAQEGVGRVAAWERWRKVWRCSPLRELDRNGLSEEIDDGV